MYIEIYKEYVTIQLESDYIFGKKDKKYGYMSSVK